MGNVRYEYGVRTSVTPEKIEVKPYYSEPGITIYHGDCRDILPHLPKVDLVLTDPPYGIGKHFGDNSSDEKINTEWFSIAKQQSKAIIFTPGIANLWAYPPPLWVLCWYKPGAISRTRYGFNSWEPVLIYDAPPSTQEPDVIVIPIGTQAEVGNHPTPKPLKLYSYLVRRFTKENETICEPFMGSGTTLRAAKDLGRKAIGIEIEERYCEIAVRRLRQEVLPFAEK